MSLNSLQILKTLQPSKNYRPGGKLKLSRHIYRLIPNSKKLTYLPSSNFPPSDQVQKEKAIIRLLGGSVLSAD